MSSSEACPVLCYFNEFKIFLLLRVAALYCTAEDVEL